jgi:hypothetical protein
MSYEKFLEEVVEKLFENRSAEFPTVFSKDLARAYVMGYTRGRENFLDDPLNPDGALVEEIKGELEKRANEGQIEGLETIEPRDVRAIMEYHGESLSDLGAGYGEEFALWMKDNHGDIYDKWEAGCSREGSDEGTKTLLDEAIDELFDGMDFIFEYSNSSLNGILSLEEHDEYLANFANESVNARKHLLSLLEQVEE